MGGGFGEGKWNAEGRVRGGSGGRRGATGSEGGVGCARVKGGLEIGSLVCYAG